MSAIFYHNEEQQMLAFQTRDREARKLQSEIRTEIISFTEFYYAEDYHQKHALQHSYEFMREFRSIYHSFDRIVSSTAAARVNGYLGGYGSIRELRAELDSYGLSPEAGKLLLGTINQGTRFHCSR